MAKLTFEHSNGKIEEYDFTASPEEVAELNRNPWKMLMTYAGLRRSADKKSAIEPQS
jgi:hypothetical protein